MGIINRTAQGTMRAVTAPVRAVVAGPMFILDETKTVIGAVETMKDRGVDAGFKKLLAETAQNAGRRTANLVEGTVPVVAFAEGFIRDKKTFESGGGLSLT